MKIILDTSIIIDYTRAGAGDFLKIVESSENIFIPMIVISELWAGKSMNKKSEEAKVEKILNGMQKVDLDEGFAKLAGKLLRNEKVVGAMDAIVAACALKIDALLATSNKKHFVKVPGLKFFDSKKI